MRSVTAFLSSIIIGLALSGTAKAQGFDPERPCGATLRAAKDQEKLLIAAWFFGYLAGTQDDVRVVNRPGMVTLLNNVFTACGKDDSVSLLGLLQQAQQGDGGAQGGTENEGTKESAQILLAQFLQANADRAALTAALTPTAEDIRAVYGEPLASKLVPMYAEMFTPGVQIGPKPDHNATLVIYATTGLLKSGDAIAGEFPGGYGGVAQYFIGDFPIVRFKFVVSGETLGLAFDGLIFVNGRWVLMPKPWRALQ